MLSNVPKRVSQMVSRQKVKERPSKEELEKARSEFGNNDDQEEEPKEDVYFANQFWKAPELNVSDIDALLAEEGFEI